MRSVNPFSRYKQPDEYQSKYCYPGTEIYINKFDCRDEQLLKAIEADFTLQAITEMYIEPIKGRFGTKHLQNIHKYMFKDIYLFAGHFRSEDISKGSSDFCRYQHIKMNLDELFSKLKASKFLVGLEEQSIIRELSYFMGELNSIHPFREGNGRAIREYIRLLSLYNGFIIDWSNINEESLLEAMIKSFNKQYGHLEACIQMCISKNLK